MIQEASEQIQCKICHQLLLKPAILPCGHQFCYYCTQVIKWKNNNRRLVCPLCRRRCNRITPNKNRQKQIISEILKGPNIRVFWGKGCCINDDDGNETKMRGLFILKENNQFIGDVILGAGTKHSTYVDQVCRGSGKMSVLQTGNMQLEGYRCYYSNDPYEEWAGVFKRKENGKFKLKSGKYTWWNEDETSSGRLKFELIEINPGDRLDLQ